MVNTKEKSKKDKKLIQKSKKIIKMKDLKKNNSENNKKNVKKNNELEMVNIEIKNKKKNNKNIIKNEVVIEMKENKKKNNKKNNTMMMNENNDIMMDMMENDDINLENIYKNSGKIDFDKILNKCLKGKDLMETSLNKNEKKRLNEEYDNSFDEILKFRSNMTKKDIESIDTIVYHNENNDGMFSAAIAYHYYNELYKNNNNKLNNIMLVPDKPKNLYKFLNPMEKERYKDRTILILDLSFSPEYLQELKKICKALYIIDDHSANNMYQNNKIFIGTNHAACANVFKFFYPKEKVPKLIKIIDISDSKLGLGKYTNYMNLVAVTIGHRYTHNKRVMKDPKILMKELWNLCELENLSSLVVIGHYMDEVEESLKEQIAINAKPMNFLGYKVGALNYNSPALNKKVLRQINTNFEKKGIPIDFAVVFGYEFSSNGYSITMADNHRENSKIDLGELAKKIAKLGGHPKGGFGHRHSSHAYFGRKPGQDIWDLFDKKSI